MTYNPEGAVEQKVPAKAITLVFLVIFIIKEFKQ